MKPKNNQLCCELKLLIENTIECSEFNLKYSLEILTQKNGFNN